MIDVIFGLIKSLQEPRNFFPFFTSSCAAAIAYYNVCVARSNKKESDKRRCEQLEGLKRWFITEKDISIEDIKLKKHQGAGLANYVIMWQVEIEFKLDKMLTELSCLSHLLTKEHVVQLSDKMSVYAEFRTKRTNFATNETGECEDVENAYLKFAEDTIKWGLSLMQQELIRSGK